MILALLILALCLGLLWQAPRSLSMGEEERRLRQYFREVDREEREENRRRR